MALLGVNLLTRVLMVKHYFSLLYFVKAEKLFSQRNGNNVFYLCNTMHTSFVGSVLGAECVLIAGVAFSLLPGSI